MRSEALHVPLHLVDLAHDAPLRVLVAIHAARPCEFAFLAEAVELPLSSVHPMGDGLSANGLLHVRAQR